jgi:hypothetical protein
MALIWVFTTFGSVGDWIAAKKDMAEEETRKLKLDNDEREMKIKDAKTTEKIQKN